MSKLYVVQRRTWYSEYSVYEDEDCIKGGGVPVAAFTTRKAAKALAKKLEQQARTEWSSPFLMISDEVFDQELGIESNALAERLREAGLEPPPLDSSGGYEQRHWGPWYDAVADSLTPAQRKLLDGVFAKLKVYEVVAVEVEED